MPVSDYDSTVSRRGGDDFLRMGLGILITLKGEPEGGGRFYAILQCTEERRTDTCFNGSS